MSITKHVDSKGENTEVENYVAVLNEYQCAFGHDRGTRLDGLMVRNIYPAPRDFGGLVCSPCNTNMDRCADHTNYPVSHDHRTFDSAINVGRENGVNQSLEDT